VLELPETSEPTFTVAWRGIDDSGIAVSSDLGACGWGRLAALAGDAARIELQTSASITGTPGSVYEFAAWAVDLAGNWSENINLRPQATTRVE
jgi:hypothetical protein